MNKINFPLWLVTLGMIAAMIIGIWIGFTFWTHQNPVETVVTTKTLTVTDITKPQYLRLCNVFMEDGIEEINSCDPYSGVIDIEGKQYYKIVRNGNAYYQTMEKYRKLFYMVGVASNGEVEIKN